MTENKTLNQRIDDLNGQIEWFYSDDFKLEEASEKYKEVVGLAKEIDKDLDELKNEIEVLMQDFSK